MSTSNTVATNHKHHVSGHTSKSILVMAPRSCLLHGDQVTTLCEGADRTLSNMDLVIAFCSRVPFCLTSKPESASCQDPLLVWTPEWPLSNWTPTYQYGCLLCWSGLVNFLRNLQRVL